MKLKVPHIFLANIIFSFLHFLGPTNDRQRAVRDDFSYAWKAYKRYAWGHDNLAPLSRGFQDWMECGNEERDAHFTAKWPNSIISQV